MAFEQEESIGVDGRIPIEPLKVRRASWVNSSPVASRMTHGRLERRLEAGTAQVGGTDEDTYSTCTCLAFSVPQILRKFSVARSQILMMSLVNRDGGKQGKPYIGPGRSVFPSVTKTHSGGTIQCEVSSDSMLISLACSPRGRCEEKL